MGTTPSQSPPSSPSSPALPFPTFCGTSSNQETLKNTKKTEIDLTSTYSLPKGTFTNDSIHLFTSMEKTLFNIIPTSNIPALRYLTINNVNINILDEDRTSPLHVASRFSSVQMIEEVINQGAMINIPDIVGWTSLHIACYYDRPDVTLLLLKNGANYKTRNRDKETPRDLALKNNCLSCVKVIDNFCKYQKIEIEKFVHELNSGFKNKINLRLDDVFKKYLKYQKLRGEFLKSHLDFNEKEEEEEEGLSDNFEEMDNFNNFNNYNNNGNFNNTFNSNYNNNYSNNYNSNLNENNKYDFNCFNFGLRKEKDEYENIEKYINLMCKEMSNRKENQIYWNKDNNFVDNNNKVDIEQYFSTPVKSSKEKKYEELLSKYKYIPHKHKFYLNYIFENGMFKSKTFKEENKDKNNILIHMPSSLPSMTSMNSLNQLKKNSLLLTNNLINIDNNIIINNDKENNMNKNNKNINNNKKENYEINEEEIYKTYSLDENNSKSSNESLDIEIENNINNKNKKLIFNETNTSITINNNDDEEDEDKTLSIDDENIAHNLIVENSRNLLNDQVIFKNISNKFYKFTNCDFSIFLKENNDIFEEILYVLFYFDYYFGLMFLISVCNINNSMLNLISYITSNIFDQKLKMLILTNSNPFILKIYFNSFYFSNISIIESIYKSFKYFDLSTNNISLIDQLSKSFSESYYEQIQDKKENHFKSQNSIYYFTFAFIITELNYKNSEDKEKIIFDMIVMLKNLNEGKNFNKEIINEAISNIKSEKNILNSIDEKYNNLKIDYKNYIKIYENEKEKIYNYFYLNGLFVLFKKNILYKFFYIKILNKIKCEIKKENNQIKVYNSSSDNKNYLYIIKNNNDHYEMIPYEKIIFEVNSTIIINDLEKFFYSN